MLFAYDLERRNFLKLLFLYSGLFLGSFLLIEKNKNRFWFLASIALIFRVIFIGAIPNLSQDFYRFIWDGRLVAEGINPFLSTPKRLLEKNFSTIAQTKILVDGMGNLNASNFSNYPPISQFVYGIAGLFAEKSILGSVVIMRLILIAADFGTLYFGKKLLEKLQLPSYQIFWFISQLKIRIKVLIRCIGFKHNAINWAIFYQFIQFFGFWIAYGSAKTEFNAFV